MTRKTLEEITEETYKLHDQGVAVSDIASRTECPQYLIESILIDGRDVNFR